MSDATDKALDTITEAEALPFISELRSDLATANVSLATAQADLATAQTSLSDANQATANAEAKVASLTASLATAEASPAKIQVILHQVNGNRLLTTLSTDAPESGTLTVHVS